MLNEYLQQKSIKSAVLSNPNEMEKLKRTIMTTFVNRFSQKVKIYSLRAQLIAIYNSIIRVLSNFPSTRAHHFVFGEANERRQQMMSQMNEEIYSDNEKLKSKKEDENYLRPDPRSFKSRPRKLLSDDGERVLNLWFIPHYTDLLTLFKKSPENVQYRALNTSVRIMGAFNDCLQFLLANAIMTVTLGKGSSSLTATSKFPNNTMSSKI